MAKLSSVLAHVAFSLWFLPAPWDGRRHRSVSLSVFADRASAELQDQRVDWRSRPLYLQRYPLSFRLLDGLYEVRDCRPVPLHLVLHLVVLLQARQ